MCGRLIHSVYLPYLPNHKDELLHTRDCCPSPYSKNIIAVRYNSFSPSSLYSIAGNDCQWGALKRTTHAEMPLRPSAGQGKRHLCLFRTPRCSPSFCRYRQNLMETIHVIPGARVKNEQNDHRQMKKIMCLLNQLIN